MSKRIPDDRQVAERKAESLCSMAAAFRMGIVLIGERPGLSSPDSMGVYVTWAPRPGRVDAERNCISNVRPEGLALSAAAERLAWLLREARQRELTGVDLKDESVPALAPVNMADSFLLADDEAKRP